MDLKALYRMCAAKKEELNLTNKDVAAMSMTSQATVSRFFQSEGEGVSLPCMRAISDALGVEFPIPKTSLSDAGCENALRHVQVIEDLHAEIGLQKDKALANERRLRLFFMVLSLALIALICGVLFYDVTHPHIGWVQY